MSTHNTSGREKNAAQPLGERRGTASKSGAAATAKREQETAGPDGPSAKELGDTFKRTGGKPKS